MIKGHDIRSVQNMHESLHVEIHPATKITSKPFIRSFINITYFDFNMSDQSLLFVSLNIIIFYLVSKANLPGITYTGTPIALWYA